MGALAIARGTGHERYDVSNHRHLDCFSPAFSFQYTRGFVSHVIEIVLIICIYGFLEIHLFYFLKFLTHEDRGKMAAISQATFSDAFSWLKSFGFQLRPSSSMNGIFCLSVRLSVCPSHLFDYVPIIVSSRNFQELLPMTEVMSMQKVKVRGQRWRSQRSQPSLTVSGL